MRNQHTEAEASKEITTSNNMDEIEMALENRRRYKSFGTDNKGAEILKYI